MKKKKVTEKRRKTELVKTRTVLEGKMKVREDAKKAGMSEEAYVAMKLGILKINERVTNAK